MGICTSSDKRTAKRVDQYTDICTEWNAKIDESLQTAQEWKMRNPNDYGCGLIYIAGGHSGTKWHHGNMFVINAVHQDIEWNPSLHIPTTGKTYYWEYTIDECGGRNSYVVAKWAIDQNNGKIGKRILLSPNEEHYCQDCMKRRGVDENVLRKATRHNTRLNRQSAAGTGNITGYISDYNINTAANADIHTMDTTTRQHDSNDDDSASNDGDIRINYAADNSNGVTPSSRQHHQPPPLVPSTGPPPLPLQQQESIGTDGIYSEAPATTEAGGQQAAAAASKTKRKKFLGLF